jgi:hypothetical protein
VYANRVSCHLITHAAEQRGAARVPAASRPLIGDVSCSVGLARVSGLGPVETEGSRLLRARFTRPFLRSAR